jgi:hypothetical protein
VIVRQSAVFANDLSASAMRRFDQLGDIDDLVAAV